MSDLPERSREYREASGQAFGAAARAMSYASESAHPYEAEKLNEVAQHYRELSKLFMTLSFCRDTP
jgi:hypothetical protein